MILTVTPNPALDLTWHLDGLHPGESHRVAAGIARAGGKGVNVARVLHAEGHEVVALVPTTDAAFADDLRASGIPHLLIPAQGAVRRSIALVDAVSGEATVLNERGAALGSWAEQEIFERVAHLSRIADVVVISGSLPEEFPPDRLAGLVGQVKATGIPVIVDTSGPGLRAAARAGASVLKPNREELLEVTGSDDPFAAARVLLDEGAGMIVLSLGSEGLAILTSADRGAGIRARLPRPLTGNPTGAGDAAVAAVAAELAASTEALRPDGTEARRRLARRATAWSASAVLMPLAGTLHPDHQKRADDVIVTDPEESS